MRATYALVVPVVLSVGCAGLGRKADGPRAVLASTPNDADGRVPRGLPMAVAEDDDYVVRVVAGEVTCSGTLIDDDLVLTAHHCVSARNRFGDIETANVAPSNVAVEVGGDYFAWGEVGVTAVLAPACGFAASRGDIAILVLERKLVGVATLPPRLDGPPKLGEPVDPVGFGRCALGGEGIRREQRAGGAIARLDVDRFKLDAAICPGDSGGPAVSEEGQVLGVISRSVMDGSTPTVGPSEFTRVDHWRALFGHARLVADGASPAELPPLDGCSPTG